MVGSPPPFLAAMMMARLNLLHSLPRLASMAPFLCLIVAQWEWPDMTSPSRSGARLTTTAGRAVRGGARTSTMFGGRNSVGFPRRTGCVSCRVRLHPAAHAAGSPGDQGWPASAVEEAKFLLHVLGLLGVAAADAGLVKLQRL